MENTGAAAVTRVVEFVDTELPPAVWPHWNHGWPRESEAALLDAVFSARAAYGTPTTGVRAVIGRWRAHRSIAPDAHLDDLSALAAFADRGDELAAVLGNRQRVPGNYSTKAEGAARAARALITSGVRTATDIEDNERQRAAVVSVPGLGPRTFETFVFVSGKLAADAIDLLARFASEASGTETVMSSADAADLLSAVSTRLGVDVQILTHAAWRYQRTAEQPRRSGGSAPPGALHDLPASA